MHGNDFIFKDLNYLLYSFIKLYFEGDGGSPLVCPIGQTWFLAGLVAWGIGCGTGNVPGVYVNVATYVPWIQSIINS